MAPASSGQGGGSAGPAGAIRQGGEGRGGERQGRPETSRTSRPGQVGPTKAEPGRKFQAVTLCLHLSSNFLVRILLYDF